MYDWGLLGYLVRDVIGAHQEESFGIRQNHSMGLKDWNTLIGKYFEDRKYEIFVPERGWGERVVKRAAVLADPHGSEWRAGAPARWNARRGVPEGGIGVGAAAARKFRRFSALSQLPLHIQPESCGFLDLATAVMRLQMKTASTICCRRPNARSFTLAIAKDIVDFSQPGHTRHLVHCWY